MSRMPAAGGELKRSVSSLADQAALVALLRLRPGDRSWTEITALLRERDDIASVLDDLDPTALFVSPEQEVARRSASVEVDRWAGDGLQFLTILDERYPAPVREIHQSPPFLFARGSLRASDPAVSVVGSREASVRGIDLARNIAAALVERRLTVVAGLAVGIDAAAHRAALEADGRTVALIATGIRRAYPAVNRELQEEIASRGLLLSQFWPDAAPQKHTFLMRNATMSGYGVATVVVEASEHSGTRAQARMAIEHGRPVVLTDLVVASTAWGKALVGRPGVFVATSVDEVITAVAEIHSSTEAIDEALHALVAV